MNKKFESTESQAKRLFKSNFGNTLVTCDLNINGNICLLLKNSNGQYYYDHISSEEKRNQSFEELLSRSDKRTYNFYHGWAVRKGYRKTFHC